MTNSPSTPEEPAVRRKAGSPGCGAILTGLLILVALTGAGVWIYTTRRDDERLAIQVARVRARREPLTTFELNDFYQPAANRPDMTREILAALAVCEANAQNPQAAGLPIVGQGTAIPALPEAWPGRDDAEAFLAHHSRAFETFREVARRDGTARFPVEFTAGIDTPLPHLQAMRRAFSLLTLQFHAKLHRGQTRDAVDCLLDQIALARTLDQEPILISQLVRLAILSGALSNVQQIVDQAKVADEDLVRLQQAMRKIDPQTCLTLSLSGERAVSYMACVEPRLAAPGPGLTPAEVGQLAQRHPRRVRDAMKMLELSLRIADAADRSLLAALQEGTRVNEEIEEISQAGWNHFLYPLARELNPAYQRIIPAFARSAAKRGCADAVLGAALYRRKVGSWPETLDQLVPEFLPSLPLDPFNNQPLKLVTTSREAKIYSVGTDGKDDHGRLADGDDPNTDLGFILSVRELE